MDEKEGAALLAENEALKRQLEARGSWEDQVQAIWRGLRIRKWTVIMLGAGAATGWTAAIAGWGIAVVLATQTVGGVERRLLVLDGRNNGNLLAEYDIARSQPLVDGIFLEKADDWVKLLRERPEPREKAQENIAALGSLTERTLYNELIRRIQETEGKGYMPTKVPEIQVGVIDRPAWNKARIHVAWVESYWDGTSARYSGVLTMTHYKEATSREFDENRAGVYATDFTFSRNGSIS